MERFRMSTNRLKILESEDALKYLGTLGPAGLKEFLEPALWQYDGLEESRSGETDQVLDNRLDLCSLVLNGLVVEALQTVGRCPPANRYRPGHLPGLAFRLESQCDAQSAVATGGDKIPGAQGVPGATTVEGKVDSLEQRRLARPGVPDDSHQVRPGE